MANEVTIPILPSRDLDDSIAFYAALGFERTYRQSRPNLDAVVAREDIQMLENGLARYSDAPKVDRVRALLYRAELAVRLHDRAIATTSLSEAQSLELTDDERAAVKDDIAHAIELVVGLHGSGAAGNRLVTPSFGDAERRVSRRAATRADAGAGRSPLRSSARARRHPAGGAPSPR